MLTDDEKRFLNYWKLNRLKEKTNPRYLYIGGIAGLLIGAGVFVSLATGWYTRAVMEANVQLNGFVFMIAIFSIAIFMAVFYRKYQWEQQEQHYLELLQKQDSEKSSAAI
ncbi:MAG: hypothetical protein JWN76_609 [Chitinophagaceae bacterium]|nr:hypothetical protein [Chitinophagaceae bacterium]